MNPVIDDSQLCIESRPERRGKLPTPEAVITRRTAVVNALANLSAAVSASVGENHEEGSVQTDNQRLAKVIENAQVIQTSAESTKTEIHGGDGSDLAGLRRQVAAAYPSDVERGGSC